MAKGFELDKKAKDIISSAKNGEFSPIYLLMGEESYYTDLVCESLIKYAFEDDSERDFNQVILFGSDLKDAEKVITAARRYPMFAQRQLVVVKEAQLMGKIEDLDYYCQSPLPSTVLIISMHGKSLDKRKALYKTISKRGVVLETPLLRDYEIQSWISMYYKSRNLDITPDAVALLAESAGVDLSKIALETDKIVRSLPQGCTKVSAEVIEANVGISRQFNAFELSNALMRKDVQKAMKIAAYLGNQAKFAMPMATSAIFSSYYKLLKANAFKASRPGATNSEIMSYLGLNSWAFKDCETGMRFYNLRSSMKAIAIIKEFDFRGKGGASAETPPSQMLLEMTTRLLNA